MNLRKSAAMLTLALVLPLSAITLSGCVTQPDGTVILEPSARAKLDTGLKWAKRFSSGAKLTLVGVTAACEGKDSKFCATAMPIVLLAQGALVIYDKGLDVAQAALDNATSPEAALAAAAADLIKLEADVEKFIDDLNAQKAEAPADIQRLLAELPERETENGF